jgi:hypothetical protein
MVPFLLGALIALLNLLDALHVGIPMWVGNGLGLGMLIACAVGLIKRLPRWSLPYVGMIALELSWILTHRGTFMGLNTRVGLLGPLLGPADRLFLVVVGPSNPWIVCAVLGVGRDWLALLGLTALGLLIVAALRPLRPLYARIRQDWTLLSFGLYGATLLAVSYTFEDYPSARYPFMVVSLFVLAAGAWVYMRGGRASGRVALSRRALPLFAAMVLAAIVGAMGKAVIYASPDWPYPHSFTWRSEAFHAVLLWGWVVAVVVAPTSLTLLPRPDRSPEVA